MPRTIRISLCMIVRDEEEFLERCLASAAPHVDEICIVDTGSQDGTVAIAERHGARIGHVPWNEPHVPGRGGERQALRRIGRPSGNLRSIGRCEDS